jgi:hypothetical protein
MGNIHPFSRYYNTLNRGFFAVKTGGVPPLYCRFTMGYPPIYQAFKHGGVPYAFASTPSMFITFHNYYFDINSLFICCAICVALLASAIALLCATPYICWNFANDP